MHEERPPSSEKGSRRSLAIAASIGSELAAFVVVGALLGRWIDGRTGSSPWGVLVCTFFGIAGGLYRLVKIVSSSQDRPSGGR